MNKLVSIIIPVYNAEKCIDRCLQSVQRQSYRNFEAIIINDGSTDNSLKLCQEYAKADKRFKVYHIENGGVSRARNKGLDMATGGYISFLDSDDYLADNFFEMTLNRIELGREKIVIASFFRETANGMFSESEHSDFFSTKVMNVFQKYDYANTFVLRHVWGALFAREAIGSIRFREGYCLGEDSLFIAEVVSKNPEISIVGEPLYYYSYSESSASHGSMDEKKATVIEAWTDIIRIYSENIASTETFLDGCYYSFYTEIRQAMVSLHNDNRLKKADPIFQKFLKALWVILPKLLKGRKSVRTKAGILLLSMSPQLYFNLRK